MAASAASSPASAKSPQALALASSSSTNKSLLRPPAPPTSLQTPSIFTNKEWVVPPRPKPGRKPAADTPPTKRKAQNRAAQRAFRERRAARVGELEEQAQQIEEEHEKERESLQYRIQQLQVEVDRYSRLVVSWRTKCQRLEEELSNERRPGSEGEKRMRPDSGIDFGNGDLIPLRPRNGSGTDTPPAISRTAETRLDDASMGCGKCSTDTRCECIEEVLEMSHIVNEAPTCTTKRQHSPSSVLENKRNRHLNVKPEEEEREIDFTEQFSTKGAPNLTSTSANSLTVTTTSDPCGFCQDGTACICAEMAAEEKQSKCNIDILAVQNSAKPLKASQNPCINGPGSCQQCRSDANSALFCKSLAASRNRLGTPRVQSSGPITFQTAVPSQTLGERPITGISLSCADAYAKLSRHPAYERATEDPGAWIPKLATIPGGVERPAFEVEAASVMQTLRFFDRRFGREA